MKPLIAFFAITFFVSIAFADNKIVGHMTPFNNERLSNPVVLDCGLVIHEIRGGSPNIAKLNSMCTHAYSNFFKFIKTKKLNVKHKSTFDWDASLIPTNTKYRSLNDETYRFHNRFVKGGDLLGYTDYDAKYMFSMSEFSNQEFNTTFVHELFHSMSMFYGIYENHSGDLSAKTHTDEQLAQEFTQWLKYGK